MPESYFVINRDGKKQPVMFDRITERIRELCFGLNENFIDPARITASVIAEMKSGMHTEKLDELASEIAAYCAFEHPDYAKLAGRILVSNLHKKTSNSFYETCKKLYYYGDVGPDTKIGDIEPPDTSIMSNETFSFVTKHKSIIDNAMNYDNDYNYEIFGYKTLERSYLLKVNKQIVERPQSMIMRVCCGIHENSEGDETDEFALAKTLESYDLMSNGYFTHATPTLFNAGTRHPQMSSCFLLSMGAEGIEADSITGIYSTVGKCAEISKHAGGIGIAISTIRAKGSYIKGTTGTSNGIVPMAKVFNSTACHVDQGGGRRAGAFALYLEPWHPDIVDFLRLRKNQRAERLCARDLSYGLWIPDLFMKRVDENKEWTLICPSVAPELPHTHSDEFEEHYLKYERELKGMRTINARKLFNMIIDAQIETGYPYMLYKDAANRKSNQQNLGCISSSNLCSEIIEYTSPEEQAVCNLASICLPKFMSKENGFDHKKLYEVARVAAYNTDRVIDKNFYPTEESRRSNLLHRPIGIGVQGLADVFSIGGMSYTSEEAQQLNKEIFETLHFAVIDESCDIAKEKGPYPSYYGMPAVEAVEAVEATETTAAVKAVKAKPAIDGCPMSKGVFQYHMWGITPSGRWDFAALEKRVAIYGVRNSQSVALMPTASTSQHHGNTESFEPRTDNLYCRKTSAGDFVQFTKYMVNDLIAIGKWDKDMQNRLLESRGSIQDFEDLPKSLRETYRNVWELKLFPQLKMMADRGAYVCQSASFNAHIAHPKPSILRKYHMKAWKMGLITGMYYLRTQAASDANQFTVRKRKKYNEVDVVETKKKDEEVDDDEPFVTTAVIDATATTFPTEEFSDDRMCTNEKDCMSCGS